jgi:hypothetical protein
MGSQILRFQNFIFFAFGKETKRDKKKRANLDEHIFEVLFGRCPAGDGVTEENKIR